MKKASNVAQPLVQAGLLGEAIDRGPVLVLVADEEMRYVAANQHACDVLGYTREELLELKTTDIARYDGAADEFAEMIRAGSRAGEATLQRKDGSEVRFTYRAQETSVAGMQLYVAAGWVEEPSPRPAARRRRSARAPG